jgi:hypothetical protein
MSFLINFDFKCAFYNASLGQLLHAEACRGENAPSFVWLSINFN